ncbi:MAG TPA: CBS domain-containing protein [Thermoleophilaceae bacterium]|nr:CBS domain-containing protein [Thermoleophilaceae bacterium]
MSPNSLSQDLVREAPLLREDQSVEHAVRAVLESALPALPVVDADGRLKGIFGEREFMTALFPGYVGQLKYAGFVKQSLDDAIDRRAACRSEAVGQHLNTDHVEVDEDFSDVQIAETFLHHRVLIIPVVADRRVTGVITRADFFGRIAERFLEAG